MINPYTRPVDHQEQKTEAAQPGLHAAAGETTDEAPKQTKAQQEKAEREAATLAAAEEMTKDTGGVAGQRLKAFIERVERLEEEKAALAEDVKDVMGEAKATGFDTKIIRKIIKLRKMDIEKRREEDELLELYKSAIGME